VGLSRREQQRLEYERRLAAAQQEHELRQQQRVLDVLERLLQAERERSQRMLEQAEKIPTGAGVPLSSLPPEDIAAILALVEQLSGPEEPGDDDADDAQQERRRRERRRPEAG
jgi:hypothetical protein